MALSYYNLVDIIATLTAVISNLFFYGSTPFIVLLLTTTSAFHVNYAELNQKFIFPTYFNLKHHILIIYMPFKIFSL